MPAYNQTLDLINTYSTKWQTTPGLDLDAEIEAMTGGDAGRLGRRRQLIDGRPPASRARAPCPVSRGWPGGARAGGTSSSRRGSSVSRCSPPPDDRDARLHVHQHQPGPGRAAPIRGPEELPDPDRPTSRPGVARDHPQVRVLALPVAVFLPLARRAPAPLETPLRVRRRSGRCSSCRTSCRSWRRSSSGAACSTRDGLDQRGLEAIGVRIRPPGSRTRRGSTPAWHSSACGASAPG